MCLHHVEFTFKPTHSFVCLSFRHDVALLFQSSKSSHFVISIFVCVVAGWDCAGEEEDEEGEEEEEEEENAEEEEEDEMEEVEEDEERPGSPGRSNSNAPRPPTNTKFQAMHKAKRGREGSQLVGLWNIAYPSGLRLVFLGGAICKPSVPVWPIREEGEA